MTRGMNATTIGQENKAQFTILIVDDEKAIREMLYEALSEQGYRVVTAQNGIEAMDRAQETHPDVVISDVMMPILDGGQLAGIISARSGVPVIGMTALSKLRREADEYFVAVFHKPFNLDQLLFTVQQLLAAKL